MPAPAHTSRTERTATEKTRTDTYLPSRIKEATAAGNQKSAPTTTTQEAPVDDAKEAQRRERAEMRRVAAEANALNERINKTSPSKTPTRPAATAPASPEAPASPAPVSGNDVSEQTALLVSLIEDAIDSAGWAEHSVHACAKTANGTSPWFDFADWWSRKIKKTGECAVLASHAPCHTLCLPHTLCHTCCLSSGF